MKSFLKLCENCKTVSDLYYALSKFLNNNSVDDSHITAEYLCMAIFGYNSKSHLYLNFTNNINSTQLENAHSFAHRRAICREPLEYITGQASFCGINFKSDKRALIPRCDTEFLIERFSQIKKTNPNIKKVLDLCTGSGIIGITIKKMFPDVKMYMSDISTDAISLAKENVSLQKVEDICLINADGLSSFKYGSFDVIIANPPYIEGAVMDSLEPEVVKWEPIIALTSGEDGLGFHRQYATDLIKVLCEGGVLLCETGGDIQTQPLKRIYEKISNRVVFFRDINNCQRVMQVEK